MQEAIDKKWNFVPQCNKLQLKNYAKQLCLYYYFFFIWFSKVTHFSFLGKNYDLFVLISKLKEFQYKKKFP